MKKYAILPVGVTLVSLVLLAATGNFAPTHVTAVSISPLALAAGTVLIVYDFRTLFLNSERSSRNDNIPELTDEEFRAHHKLFGSVFIWWAVPHIVPALWFGTAGKIIFSFACFFLSYIGTGIYAKLKFRDTIQTRRRTQQKELELQIKRESGWT